MKLKWSAPEKRFLVFAYEHYYPMGPEADQQATFDSVEECKAYMTEHKGDYEHWILFDCDRRAWTDL